MKTNPFEQFAVDLYRECPRAAFALESMKYGIMARTGLDEKDALEVACRIVLTGRASDETKTTHTRTAAISGRKTYQRLQDLTS